MCPPSCQAPASLHSAAAYTVTPQDRDAGALRADLELRLRRACADLPPATFEAVVSDLVAFRLRWSMRGPW